MKPQLFGPWPLTVYHTKMLERWERLRVEAIDACDIPRATECTLQSREHRDFLKRDGHLPSHSVAAVVLFAATAVWLATVDARWSLFRIGAVALLAVMIVGTIVNMRRAWRDGMQKLRDLESEEERVIPL